VKGKCVLEHIVHLRHRPNVPLSDVAVECVCVTKHSSRGQNSPHIPAREVSVEFACEAEHCMHVSHTTHVPLADVAVEAEAIVKHVSMLVTRLVFQPPIFSLRDRVQENVSFMFVTRRTSHAEISWLKDRLSLNKPSRLVTNDVSQPGISTVHATPQLAAPEEQQLSPEGTAARHLSTTVLRAAKLGKAEATPPMHALCEAGSCVHVPGGPAYAPLETSSVPEHTLASDLS